jgi:DNA uptake protein ComE-like DNA-binding protein
MPSAPRTVWIAAACLAGAWVAAPTAAQAQAQAANPPPAPAQQASPERPPLPTPGKPTVVAKRVDLNKASRAELLTLPGIHEAEAGKIIAGRPWRTKTELVERKVIPEGVYVAIKHRVVVSDPRGAPAKK